MKKMLLLSCCLLAGAAARADDALPPVEIAYQKHILGNGLTVILHEDHKAPIVTANIWYHVGSKNEQPGKTGFAHLFEHLMLNGSQHYNDDFFKPLEAIGASNINGTTNSDRTNYYATVPTPALDRLLWLLSDQMGYLLPAVDQPRLDEQRGVVENEKRQGENKPYGHVQETLAAALYPTGHPYSWTTIGSKEDLDHASIADVQAWFRQWYGAGNAVLVVAGDIQPDEALKKIEHYFGGLSGGPVLARPQRWIAPLPAEKRVALQDRVPQTLVQIVWPVPGSSEDENTLLSLAADVLGGGRNSRLYKRLVYRDRSATSAGTWFNDRELSSELAFDLMVKPGGDAAAVESAAREELAKFLHDGPTAEELARVKTARYAGFVRGLESISGKSAVLAESEIYGGRPDDYLRSLKVLREATPEQVRTAAVRWLGAGRVVLTVTPVPDYAPAAGDADRAHLPAVGATPNVHLPPFERATLSNGLKLVLAQRHEAPVVNMNLIVDAGQAAGAGGKPGLPGYTASMLMQGTVTRDLFAISQREEELGADVGSELSDDSSNVTLSAIKARLEPSVELYADVALHPSFPADEVERLKPLRLAAIAQMMSSPQGITTNLLPQLLYRDGHPYDIAYAGLGGADAIRSTTADDLRAFYRRWYRPDNATLVVAGDITLPELKALAEKYFGAWQAPPEA
ncbi:MAG TPA: pitrilysin family protein, partial [Nevskiaceae bacterium]|nr:pitrilysin family protein [Nevskiaceae bacterium]